MHNAVRIRASSWPSLFDCAMRWEAQNLLGMHMPSSPRAQLGTAVHGGTAVFDEARMSNTPITIDDAAGAFVDELNSTEREVDWRIDNTLTKREAEKIGLTLVTRYCADVSPNYTFAAVELAIEPFNIDCGDNLVIQLTGTLDRTRVRVDTNGKGISDIKTGGAAVGPSEDKTKRVAKTKGHAAQIGTYELLAENTLGEPMTEPGEIIGMKTTGKPEIANGFINNAKLIMLGDQDNPGLIEHAATMLKSGMFPPNPQSWCCSKKYCPRWDTCLFHD